jgi:hypothetical protein
LAQQAAQKRAAEAVPHALPVLAPKPAKPKTARKRPKAG